MSSETAPCPTVSHQVQDDDHDATTPRRHKFVGHATSAMAYGLIWWPIAYGAPEGSTRALRGSAVPLARGAPEGGTRAVVPLRVVDSIRLDVIGCTGDPRTKMETLLAIPTMPDLMKYLRTSILFHCCRGCWDRTPDLRVLDRAWPRRVCCASPDACAAVPRPRATSRRPVNTHTHFVPQSGASAPPLQHPPLRHTRPLPRRPVTHTRVLRARGVAGGCA
eukprot:460819-Prymnesium_polylepis.1